MKHVGIHFHFIRWIVKEGSLHLIYCPTGEMVADAFTKAYLRQKSNTSLGDSGSSRFEGECWNLGAIMHRGEHDRLRVGSHYGTIAHSSLCLPLVQ